LTLIVALHELLGHGTGKLLTIDEKGGCNFPEDFINPYTNKPAKDTAYSHTETWSQKWGKLHSGYEECRADSTALYLMIYDEPFEIFLPGRNAEWDDIYYNGWLDILYSAVRSLKFFNAETK
jgi:dipeptidyl-peptidase-3